MRRHLPRDIIREQRKNRQIKQIIQTGHRRSSPPTFLKCTTNLVAAGLFLLIVAYLVGLFFFFRVDVLKKPDQVHPLVKTYTQVHENDDRITIGIASTITGCGEDPFIDGAAVLKYNLDTLSERPESRFKYHNYVFYHPNATECALPLKDLGYILLEKPTPIKVEEIGGDGGLRERIVNNGCCGEVRMKIVVLSKTILL